jgi:hypothetical protein
LLIEAISYSGEEDNVDVEIKAISYSREEDNADVEMEDLQAFKLIN